MRTLLRALRAPPLAGNAAVSAARAAHAFRLWVFRAMARPCSTTPAAAVPGQPAPAEASVPAHRPRLPGARDTAGEQAVRFAGAREFGHGRE